MALWYEGWYTVEGAQTGEEEFADEWAATAWAERRKAELEADEDIGSWAVYVMPHFCDRAKGGCECAQFLADHHPYAESEPFYPPE